ncbi:diguanylate phosphodiesterase [Bacillus methanolicus PB1]|uniref:Diguanylate phosphodiesterase n=1 Tax=Bacillus methanolicus PB1 TaxID=997296 RepID=I3E5B1_BACMT|nr:EAL domain-containing protein [Bacillus methanolicus]EIJ81682.1 diguanylate phosphodiesterase [Bacillus methanolicus PB1]
MDALDILTNLDNVIPYFQPIFSADEHKVIGYEILGRYNNESEIISLGPFFHDHQIPEEYKLEVDNTVLTKALEKAISLDQDVLLFVNRDAELLMHDNGEHFLQLLLEYQQKGIALERIVIEISDRNYEGRPDHLEHLLNYYKTFGLKIAIDKIGNDSSHLDRIGQLSPDILKVDLGALRSINTGPSYQAILYSLSLLARKIGAMLHFENIETAYQLQFAWKNGGRYFQGFYLHKPYGEFISRELLKEWLGKEFHQFISYEKKKLEALFNISEEFQEKVQNLLNKFKKYEDYTELLHSFAKHLDGIAFRMYVCDEDGFQKSPNIFKKDKNWILQNEYLKKNWSWRPYFLENIIRMRNEKKGILSDLYSDIETGETIRTFSFPLNNKDFLFIDLSYNYLYEHEGLL